MRSPKVQNDVMARLMELLKEHGESSTRQLTDRVNDGPPIRYVARYGISTNQTAQLCRRLRRRGWVKRRLVHIPGGPSHGGISLWSLTDAFIKGKG